MLLLQAAWLLAPGLLAGALLRRRGLLAPYLVVPVAVLVGCLVGYGALWTWFASRSAGQVYSVATIVLSVGCLAALIGLRTVRKSLSAVDVLVPLALMLLLSFFFTSITFACSVGTPVNDTNQFCHINGLTGDNVLPLIFADNMHHGNLKALTWTWQGSDRPPLQSGVVLAQTPLIQAAGWKITSYLTVAILLQLAWLPAAWAACRALRLSGVRLAAVLALCVFSGFFLYNSVFTWPKLLAAGLVITAFTLWFQRTDVPGAGRAWTYVLAGLSAGAGMLAHTGVAFTLLPIGVILLTPRYRPKLKMLLLTGAAGLIMLAPWMAYQKLYDPPGDTLLRLHIGGAVDDRSLGETVYDNYTKTSIATIAKNKIKNVTTLFGYPNPSGGKLAGTGITASIRVQEFVFVLFGLGLFNIGWLVLVVPSWRRRAWETLDRQRVKLMLTVAGFSVLVWVLLMYGGHYATPVIFQGSYATMMLLYLALGALITTLPRRVLGAILGVQMVWFALIWVATVWRGPKTLYPSYIGLSVLLGIAVLAGLVVVARRAVAIADTEPEQAPEPGTAEVGAQRAPADEEVEEEDVPVSRS